MHRMEEEHSRQRINAQEREIIMCLYAFKDALNTMIPRAQNLARRVPNGYRDLRCALALTDKTVEKLLNTIPVKQLKSLAHQLKITEISLRTKSAGNENPSFHMMDTEDIATLVQYIIDSRCVLCDGSDKNECKLRKVLQDLPVVGIDSLVMPCIDDDMFLWFMVDAEKRRLNDGR